jgi:hypothetical protein
MEATDHGKSGRRESACGVCVGKHRSKMDVFRNRKRTSLVCLLFGGQFLTELENRNTLHISTRALFVARAKHDLYDSYYSNHSPVSTRA